jgi:hypothetical protein
MIHSYLLFFPSHSCGSRRKNSSAARGRSAYKFKQHSQKSVPQYIYDTESHCREYSLDILCQKGGVVEEHGLELALILAEEEPEGDEGEAKLCQNLLLVARVRVQRAQDADEELQKF